MTAAAPSTSVSQGAEGFNPAKWGDYPIPEWPVSVSELPSCVRASQLCQHIPGDAGGFPKKELQRLNRAGQKKNLWNMVWLWLLPSDTSSSEYSIPILSYLTSFEPWSPSTTLLELLAAIYPWFFSQQSFGGGGRLCEFFSPRGIRNGVTLCITKHLHHHRTIKETSALVYITHSYICNKQHMQAGQQNF